MHGVTFFRVTSAPSASAGHTPSCMATPSDRVDLRPPGKPRWPGNAGEVIRCPSPPCRLADRTRRVPDATGHARGRAWSRFGQTNPIGAASRNSELSKNLRDPIGQKMGSFRNTAPCAVHCVLAPECPGASRPIGPGWDDSVRRGAVVWACADRAGCGSCPSGYSMQIPMSNARSPAVARPPWCGPHRDYRSNGAPGSPNPGPRTAAFPPDVSK